MDVPQKAGESLWESDGSGEENLGWYTEEEFYFCLPSTNRDKLLVIKHLNFLLCKNKRGKLD